MMEKAAAAATGPPLLHRFASRLSSLLGPSDKPDEDRAPSTTTTTSSIDPRWLGQQEQALPRELLLCALGYLPLSGLGAFAATCRLYAALLLVEGAGDALALYRCVCVYELGVWGYDDGGWMAWVDG